MPSDAVTATIREREAGVKPNSRTARIGRAGFIATYAYRLVAVSMEMENMECQINHCEKFKVIGNRRRTK